MPPNCNDGDQTLRKLYQWIIDRAASPYAELWLAGLAFADGGLFPFPPHALLGLMCLARPQRALRFGIITTLASLAGGLLGYAIGHFLFALVGMKLLHALGLAASFPKAACYLRAYGAEILLIKAMTPIPFMVMTLTSGFISFPLGVFLAASAVSRAVVFISIGLLFRIFGPPIKAFIDKYFMWVAGGFLAVVAGGYVLVSILGGGAHATSRACDAATTIPGAPA